MSNVPKRISSRFYGYVLPYDTHYTVSASRKPPPRPLGNNPKCPGFRGGAPTCEETGAKPPSNNKNRGC